MLELSSDKNLTLAEIKSIALSGKVRIDSTSLEILSERRKQIVQAVKSQKEPAYGFNRGFGHNVHVSVPSAALKLLQDSIIRSHASGIGPDAPREIVRAAMLLRANSLIRGHSGVRPEVVEQLVAFLNNDITPVVPQFGSVGASGDLAPLSHIALALIGEGDVIVGGKKITAMKALSESKLTPLDLEMKEGLALNNGCQFSTAVGVLAYFQTFSLLQSATLATALSTQVLLGTDAAFDPDLQHLRPHPGAQKIGSWLTALMADSPLREAHRHYHTDAEVQDPYSLRCSPQILGTCFDLLEDARKTFEIEANSVTDNPLILKDPETGEFTKIVSAGHFHGMPIAVRIYGLLQALAIMCSLSNTRCARYVDEQRNRGLGADLIWPVMSKKERAVSSGFMVAEYGSASLTNFIWGQCMPNHLFSIPTDAGQEDHVSMSAGLAIKLFDTLPRAAETIAIELAFASQAAAIRRQLTTFPSRLQIDHEKTDELKRGYKLARRAVKRLVGTGYEARLQLTVAKTIDRADRKLSSVCEETLAEISKLCPAITSDTPLAPYLAALSSAVREGTLLAAAESRGCFS